MQFLPRKPTLLIAMSMMKLIQHTVQFSRRVYSARRIACREISGNSGHSIYSNWANTQSVDGSGNFGQPSQHATAWYHARRLLRGYSGKFGAASIVLRSGIDTRSIGVQISICIKLFIKLIFYKWYYSNKVFFILLRI